MRQRTTSVGSTSSLGLTKGNRRTPVSDDRGKWEPDRSRQNTGLGLWVKRNDQLGHAKFDNPGAEWLVAQLAKLVSAPAATVEIGEVRGNRAAISHLRSPRTVDLASSRNSEADLCAAFKRSSGLIPFLAWIGASDHGKEANFAVTPIGDGVVHVEAIDFDDCFKWDVKLDALPMIPMLTRCVDSSRLERMVCAIESLSDATILETCRQSGLSDAADIANALIDRRNRIGLWLKQKGLIGST
jgi:hypothetical protein